MSKNIDENKNKKYEEIMKWLKEKLSLLSVGKISISDACFSGKRIKTLINETAQELTLPHNKIAKDLLTNTEHPSKYRTKYIQRLLRNTYALMKDEYSQLKPSTKKQYDKILNSLKQIDDILIAMTLITSIYLTNRIKLANQSKKTLNQISSDIICSNVIEPFDVSVNKRNFEIKLDCPVNIDDVIVPHEPMTEKLKNISCEITQNVPICSA